MKEDLEKREEKAEELEELDIEEVVAEPGEEVKRKDVDKLREHWKPKTDLGRQVKSGAITDIDYILDRGIPVLEPEIVDFLVSNLEVDLLLIGQAKGKFGGGQRRVFRQTQKKTNEGNKPHFAACAVIGNKDGYIGMGYGKSKETVPAREKAIRNAKLNLMKVLRGSGSWESATTVPSSLPFEVEGRCGSVRIRLIPAPRGKGLIAETEVKKILRLAGYEDVWTKTYGQTNTRYNLVIATFDALRKIMKMRVSEEQRKKLVIVEGRCK